MSVSSKVFHVPLVVPAGDPGARMTWPFSDPASFLSLRLRPGGGLATRKADPGVNPSPGFGKCEESSCSGIGEGSAVTSSFGACCDLKPQI